MARIRGYVPYKIEPALNGGKGGLLSHAEEQTLAAGADLATVRPAGSSSRTTCGWQSERPGCIAGGVFLSRTLFRRGTSGSRMQKISEFPSAGGCMRLCTSVY
jgi:hypothetical protein